MENKTQKLALPMRIGKGESFGSVKITDANGAPLTDLPSLVDAVNEQHFRLQALGERVVDLAKERERFFEANKKLVAEKARVEAKAAILAAALDRYGQHRPDCAMALAFCPQSTAPMSTCDCGLHAALQERPPLPRADLDKQAEALANEPSRDETEEGNDGSR